MICLYCGFDNQGSGLCCGACGKQMPAYGAPEGFFFDKESGLYHREGEKGTVFFDPITGEYRVEAVPTAQREEPNGWIEQTTSLIPQDFVLSESSGLYYREEPDGIRWYDPLSGQYEFQQAVVPSFELLLDSTTIPSAETLPSAMTQTPSSQYALPEGFTQDIQSGLAYRMKSPIMQDGQEITAVTWFDPATGEYAQIRYITLLEQPPTVMSAPAPSPAPETNAPKPRRRGLAAAAVLLVVVLLAGSSGLVWAVMSGWVALPFLAQSTSASEVGSGSQSRPAVAEPPEAAASQAAVPDGKAIVWRDAQFERIVREYLRRPADDIYPEDLNDIIGMRIRKNEIVLISGPSESEFSLRVEQPASSMEDLRNFRDIIFFGIYELPGVTDFSVLRDLLNLHTLSFEHMDGPTIVPQVLNLTGVRYLAMEDSNITNEEVRKIASMDWLDALILNGNPITDITPLSNMPNLSAVQFFCCYNLKDLTALGGLSKLQQVDVRSTSVTDFSPVAHVEQLLQDENTAAQIHSSAADIDLERVFENEGFDLYWIMEEMDFLKLRELGLLKEELADDDGLLTHIPSTMEDVTFAFRSKLLAEGGYTPVLCISFDIYRLTGTDEASLKELYEQFGGELYEIISGTTGEQSSVYGLYNGYAINLVRNHSGMYVSVGVMPEEEFLPLYVGDVHKSQPLLLEGR